MVDFFSFLVVRAGAIALMKTGMDRNRAVFQALSAFTGTGFTTTEAESITRNYKRRRIISILMILGNAGIVAVLISVTSSLVMSEGYGLVKVTVLMGSRYVGSSISDVLAGDGRLRIMGIQKDGERMVYPPDDLNVDEGDKLVAYGPIEIIMAHFRR